MYLCSPSNHQPKFERAVIRSRFQVTLQFHRPSPSDPLRHRCNVTFITENDGFVCDFPYENLIFFGKKRPFQAVTIEYLDKIGSGLQDGVLHNTYFKSTFGTFLY